MASVLLETSKISDWDDFHDYCLRQFGFPGFYGRNMNAWIDCLTYLPEGDGMSRFVLDKDEQLFIHVRDYDAFSKRLPDVCEALLGCTAFVNQRYMEEGDIPRLVLVLQ